MNEKERDKIKEKRKIKNLILLMRTTKEEIHEGDKTFEIYVIRDTPARATVNGVVVDTKFFKYFNKKERLAMLYHEEYHNRLSTKIKFILNIFKLRSFRRANWEEEFEADKYAGDKTSKFAIISFLKKSKKLYKIGEIAYNKKSHPPINERINRIEKDKYGGFF